MLLAICTCQKVQECGAPKLVRITRGFSSFFMARAWEALFGGVYDGERG